MSNEIDWSKAPEGATHYDPLDNNWLRQVVGTALVWCGGGTGWGEKTWQYNNDLSTMRRLIVRALPWNGEGLPPVGTVCEVFLGQRDGWKACKVLAHTIQPNQEDQAVVQMGELGFVTASTADDFRTIRTAEGLPPVGTVCEAQWKVPHKGDTRFHKCMIIHHDSKGEAVAISLEADMDSCPFWVGLARPIRTAEQITAEERQAEIDRIHRYLAMSGAINTRDEIIAVAHLLYESGYRKVCKK